MALVVAVGAVTEEPCGCDPRGHDPWRHVVFVQPPPMPADDLEEHTE